MNGRPCYTCRDVHGCPFDMLPARGRHIRLERTSFTLSETRLKIALFIDFDNIEIGDQLEVFEVREVARTL